MCPETAERLDYFDFEMTVDSVEREDYQVTVIRSPAGEAREKMPLPDRAILSARLLTLERALNGDGTGNPTTVTPEQSVQGFGQTLFEALFPGEVRTLYRASTQAANQKSAGLRLKLRIQPPELAALPWEFLYDEQQGEYLCLSRYRPLIRYIQLPRASQPLAVAPPLRILGLVASPLDLPQLDTAREIKRVEEALEKLQQRGLVNLTWLQGQTWRDLQKALRQGPWHVFHFTGHGIHDEGSGESSIALCTQEGEAHYFKARELGRLLADHPALRLVLLNSCEGAQSSNRSIFSSAAAVLAQRGIPAIVAMQYAISDTAAIEFARTFYESLADGMPVDAAVADARVAMSLDAPTRFEWVTPVLYTRCPDGVLFELQKRTTLQPISEAPWGERNYQLNVLLFILTMIVLTFWAYRHWYIYLAETVVIGGTLTIGAALSIVAYWLKWGFTDPSVSFYRRLMGRASSTKYLALCLVGVSLLHLVPPRQLTALRIVPSRGLFTSLPRASEQPQIKYYLRITAQGQSYVVDDFRRQAVYVGADDDDIKRLIKRDPDQAAFREELSHHLRERGIPPSLQDGILDAWLTAPKIVPTKRFKNNDKVLLEVGRDGEQLPFHTQELTVSWETQKTIFLEIKNDNQ